jgi:drug/metabolite transporter (DMT)-like permease
LLGLGSLWGASFLFIEVLVDETGPMEVVFGRLALGLVAVAAFIAYSRRRVAISRGLLLHVSVMAIVSNIIPFGLISWGQEHIESGTASILNATVPIFTAAIAAALLEEERFTTPRAAGLLLAFLGVGVLTGEDALHVTDSSVLGQLAVIGAAACYGIGAVYARNLLRTQDAVSLSSLQLALASLYSVPVLLAASGGRPDFALSLEAYGSLLALGLLGTGAGYIAYLWLIENIGSVRASMVTFIIPVVAVFLGWAVLDEGVGLNTVGGGLLIVAGVASVMRGQAPPRQVAEPVRAPAAGGR